MAKSAHRKRRKSRKTHKQKRSRGWILHLIVIILIVIAARVIWLDQNIQQHFEGQRWALPATVYARPLELFPGQKVTINDLIKELELLGYRRSIATRQKGEFSASDSVVNFYSRGFTFVDGTEYPNKISLKIVDNSLQSIKNLVTGDSIPLVRLEPVEISKIYPAHHEDRVLIKLDNVPIFLIKALLATEDRRFYEHSGIDPKGIARAFITNLKAMRIRQGASTLTQQLIKNFYLTHERTYWRKANELIMALLLERRYEKNDILEAYLNEVFLGQDNSRAIHGFGLAAEYYFGAPLNELRHDQLAMLVGLVKGPSYYDPLRHPDRARERRDVVLKSMNSLGLLDQEQLKTNLSAKLDLKPGRSLSRSRYPAFTDLVRKQLRQNYAETDLRSAGLRIFTTLDPIVQDKAERVIKERLRQFDKDMKLAPGQLQGAILVTDIHSGEIKAVLGSRDASSSGYNRAVYASRPIGSLIKPVVYLTALEQGKTLASMIRDEAIAWKLPNGNIWRPENYDKKFYGEVPLIMALEHSYNAATVNLGKDTGLDRIVKRLSALGLEQSLSAYPSLLLGAIELSPLQVSRIYQTLANDGFSIPPRTIRAVLTQENKPLQTYELKIGKVIEPEAAYLIKYAMSEVVRTGTARSVAAVLPGQLPLAGKTGTTGELRDSWFAGFDENTLTVVWLGRDDNKPAGLTGSSGALRVWIDLMKNLPVSPLDQRAPTSIEWYWINPQTGKLIERDCKGAIPLPFIKGTQPHEQESCHQNKRGVKEIFRGWLP